MTYVKRGNYGTRLTSGNERIGTLEYLQYLDGDAKELISFGGV
jgi:hypothetical protein